MFNINKPAFGTPSNNNSSFFTSTPSNRFGDNFVKPNAPNFGEFNKTVAPNFGNTSFNNNSNTSAFAPNPFGQSSSTLGQSYFGNVFNNSLPQQNDFFGNQFTPNEKSAFNFAAKPTAFVFGQNNPQTNVFKQQSATGMFPSSGFGPPASSTIPPGTVIKFVPVKLTDTSIIKGINQTINGKNQCITCMKEYEDKSLEELRWEDYQANRKGPQDNFFFTNTTTEPMTMEAPTTLNMFSQENNLNKNFFGFKFGTASVATSSNPPTGLFGKSVYGFGNTNTAQSTAPNYFGTTNTVTNNFQTQQQQQPIQTTNSNLFNRNTPFNNNPTINNLQQQSSLFPGLNTNTTFSFGNSPTVTSTAVIGQSTFGQNIFNSSPMKPPTQQSVFNTSFKSAFPGLTNHANAPVNTNTNNNIFKFNPTIPQQCTFNSQQQYLPPQQQYLPPPPPQNQFNLSVINPAPNHEQILAMSSTPYGLSDLLNNIKEIDNSIKDSTRATNPNELKTLLKTVKPETKIIHDKLQPIHIFRKADQSMFDDLDIEETLVQQKNPKKLVLKNYPFVDDYKEEYFGGIFENMTNTNTSTMQNEEVTVEAATQVEDELEETVNEIKEDVINPTGIILTRPEYYTVPPLEELIDFINEEDGSCIVQGFTVGRFGYGNVYFPEAFDVSNLNLDELVHFCYKEVTIYPDDSKKPPQGEGLNRKAQITLDKVWPYDKKTNMLITDIDALTEMDYADRLRRLCDRQQTKFVDYRPDTGSWVFRVDHFSKYGDEDDDDDDDDDDYDITEQASNLLITNDLIMNEAPTNENLVNYLSDGFSKCTLMKSTFFNDISDAESVASTNKFDFSDDSSTLLLDIFAGDNDQNQLEDVVDNSGLPFRIPLEKSYFKYFKIYCDTAGFKGRSFKIGWFKQTQFLTLAHQNNILENSIQINQIETYTTDSLILHQCLEDHLNIQLNNSQYDFTDAQSIPNFSSTPGFKLLEGQQNNCCGVGLENDVWKLCGALFGQIRENDLWDARSITRKTLLTKWLQGVLQKDVVFSPDDASNVTIMKYLCLHKIEGAAQFAFQQDNMNLSMLVSQLPSNLATRSFLMKQLYVWRDMPRLIDCDLLKIYLLVCGLAQVEFGNDRTISVYEDMNWLQAVALYLWYVIRTEEPIANGINLYERSFSNDKRRNVAKPNGDLRYQLLKYYSDNEYPMEKVLDPLAHTTNLLDFRFSWLLLQMLESLGQCDIEPKVKRSVHLNFAAQLEEMQLWHWAVFVLLFVEDAPLKTELIKEVIGRNVQVARKSKGYTEREQFLVESLRIPARWLEAAKATLARRLGNTRDAICHLCYAEQWAEAYSLLMDMLLPNAFFGYDYHFLCRMLGPLAPHKSTLPHWEERGGLILDFARLGIECDSSDPESGRFRASVVHVHASFRDISDLSYIRHVAARNWWSLLDHLLN